MGATYIHCKSLWIPFWTDRWVIWTQGLTQSLPKSAGSLTEFWIKPWVMKKSIEVDGLVRGEVEENLLPFLLSFTPLLSCFLLSHVLCCKWLASFPDPRIRIAKRPSKGFYKNFLKVTGILVGAEKRNLTCARKTTCHNRRNHLSSPLPSLLDRAK